MRDFVDVDAAVVGFLLVVTIPALREGECGRKGVTESSPMGLGDRARFSPEKLIRGWSLEVGIMGCIEHHLGGGKDREEEFLSGWKRLGSVRAEQRAKGHVS